MDKIKRFIDCYVPVTTCTLRCHYCYITHHRLFDNKLPTLSIHQSKCEKRYLKKDLVVFV